MKLVLVRHAQTDANLAKVAFGTTDIDINENGVAQAHKLGLHLKTIGFRPEVIYSSHLRRAIHTSEILSGYLDAPVFSEPLLREIFYGKLEGSSRETMIEVQFGYNTARMIDAGAELVPEVADRIRTFLSKISSVGHKNVLCVGHGMSLSVFVQVLLNEELIFANIHPHKNADFSQFELEISSPIKMDNYQLLCLGGPAF